MMTRRAGLSFILIAGLLSAILVPVLRMARAQDDVALTVFVDRDTLTVFAPGNQFVSLQGLGFETVIGDVRQTFYLDEYESFKTIRFDAVPTPACFRLARAGTAQPLPRDCDPGRTLTHTLTGADVFWYDAVANQSRTLLLVRRADPLYGFCGAGQDSCSIVYVPPTFTPAPTHTPTVTPTSAPTLTPTLTPTATTTFTPSPTLVPAGSSNRDWTPVIETFDGVEMVLVPGGCFMMGSEDGREDEQPVHEVCLDAFWIDKYEVTNAQFAAFDGQAGRASRWTEDDRPREQITWVEANDFCVLRGTRLPTEAEWEYAARGPEGWVFPWGDDFEADNVVYSGNSGNQTADVGSQPDGASWVGALDMSGNVWEWVADGYDSNYYSTLEDGVMNPTGPVSDNYRVLRGGSFNYDTFYVRSAFRGWDAPGFGYYLYGFRCARSNQ